MRSMIVAIGWPALRLPWHRPSPPQPRRARWAARSARNLGRHRGQVRARQEARQEGATKQRRGCTRAPSWRAGAPVASAAHSQRMRPASTTSTLSCGTSSVKNLGRLQRSARGRAARGMTPPCATTTASRSTSPSQPRDALRQHRDSSRRPRLPAPPVGLARGKALRVLVRQLVPELALPVPVVDLAQPVVGAIAVRRQAELAAHDLHGLARARQRARDVVEAALPRRPAARASARPLRAAWARPVALSGMSRWPW